MRAIAVAVVALLCSGCFVFDELDKAEAMEQKYSPNRDKHVEQIERGSGESSGVHKTARQRLEEYYAKQRASAPEPPKNVEPGAEVGRCRIGNTVQFTRKTDCDLRGGTFL